MECNKHNLNLICHEHFEDHITNEIISVTCMPLTTVIISKTVHFLEYDIRCLREFWKLLRIFSGY